jgi:hypothetical protein
MPYKEKSSNHLFGNILGEAVKSQSGYESWDIIINMAANKIREGRSADYHWKGTSSSFAGEQNSL